MLMQFAGTRIECNRHGVGLEPQAVFAGALANRAAHIVQVVVAFFELVLQCHGFSS
jgi:hypothetical protein